MAFENDQDAWDHHLSGEPSGEQDADHEAVESDFYSDASDGEKFALLQGEKHYPAVSKAYKSAFATRMKYIAKVDELAALTKPTPAQRRSGEGAGQRACDADDAFQQQRTKLKNAAQAYALRGTAPNQVSH